MTWLAVFDVDGTLTNLADSWRFFHEKLGTWSKAKRHAELFFSGAIDYGKWAELDVGLWRGVNLDQMAKLAGSVSWRSGAERLSQLKEYGYKLIAVTTGISLLADRALRELGFDRVIANRLEVEGCVLTGKMKVEVEYWGKGVVLRRLMEEEGAEFTVVVGDGVPDVEMFKEPDVSVAFNPLSLKVKAASDITIRSEDLNLVVNLLVGLALSFRGRATIYRRLP
ncbi:MAG: phosphoserine phosphatase [Thermoprotei archaeon]|nr:MAG: phosphoserine phosphatase [Thermoprotei archaeon]